MNLLKNQSSSCKKRLQHQLYLARECPDSVFDISSCEITEVPPGVFSLCRVLQKEALLVHSNWLTTLKGTGNFADLSGIRILDLHDNHLTSLPDEIGSLHGLQVLNLEKNRLKSLPTAIGNLYSLQTLNLRDNRLKAVPDEIGQLCSLRILDLSANSISVLPKPLCLARTLETLTLDDEKMVYPGSGICGQGTESVMRFLCLEMNVEYLPPSKVLLDVLPLPNTSDPVVKRCRSFSTNEEAILDTVMEYEALKDKRRQERLTLERQLDEDLRQQVLLVAQAAAEKKNLLEYMAQEQARMHNELESVHQQKEVERERLFEALTEVERSSSELVRKLLEMNEKARKTEELLEQMEKERVRVEQSYMVRQEELENIRRTDVLASMEKILEQNNCLDNAVRRYLDSQDDVIRRSRVYCDDRNDLTENVLNAKQRQQQLLIQQLLQEEVLQKEAFEALQCRKDARHKRVTSQIHLIEQELTELTLLEMEQSDIRLSIQMNILEEKRRELTALLIQLLDERKKREDELRARLLEMEEQRLANQTDYWLVQYQRLLDAKPQIFIDQEHRMELQLMQILEEAGANKYLPQFALHRITVKALLQMNDDALKRIGMHEEDLRKAMMREIENFTLQDQRAVEDRKDYAAAMPSLKDSFSRRRISKASPFTDLESIEIEDVKARGINSQCAVCMDAQSEILFLNCGHVCTCAKCAEPLKECPLDRADIIQKIRILPSPGAFATTDDAF